MAGMKGYSHKCNLKKYDYTSCKRTINNAGYTDSEIKQIWEFYVTKSIAEQSSQSVKLENYGWDQTQNKKTGYPALEALLAKEAKDCLFCFVRAKTIKDTLSEMDLANNIICIDHPRAVLRQNFSYSHDENETVSLSSKEGRIVCLMRHIRNSFAHGNTYFLPNDNILLEDFETKNVTAKILIPQRALLSWITIIDKDNILSYRNEE